MCLQAILVAEIIVFGIFGIVQLLQQWGWLKGRHRASELMYVFMSLLAKTSLGGVMFVQVLFV